MTLDKVFHNFKFDHFLKVSIYFLDFVMVLAFTLPKTPNKETNETKLTNKTNKVEKKVYNQALFPWLYRPGKSNSNTP